MSHTLKIVGAVAVIAGMSLTACSTSSNKHHSSSNKTAAAAGSKTTLYARLGGLPAIKAVVDDFVNRAAADPAVNFTRANVPGVQAWNPTPENVAHVKSQIVDFICMATGGPCKYTGKDMKSAHQNMKITDAEFGAIAADLKLSLDKFKVPLAEQTELLGIVGNTRADIVGH